MSRFPIYPPAVARRPPLVLEILGIILGIVAVAALLSMLSGCGENIIYAERMTEEQVRPIRDAWEAIGAPANIVAAPRGAPDHSDRIRIVRHGYLQAVVGRAADKCATTPTGGLIVWDGSLETRDIEIDADCVEAAGGTMRDTISHEISHWMGNPHHLPPGEVGITAAEGMTDGKDHELSCADKRLWAAFSGTRADCDLDTRDIEPFERGEAFK